MRLSFIYYGEQGLELSVLAAFFSNLHYDFCIVESEQALTQAVRSSPHPILILSRREPPKTLLRIARACIADPSSAFPHVFILYDGDPFDAGLEGITVLTGSKRLSRLYQEIRALIWSLPPEHE